MYGGYYGMGPGMRGNYGGGPMTQQQPQQPHQMQPPSQQMPQQPQQPLHMQPRMRGPMGAPMNGPMNGQMNGQMGPSMRGPSPPPAMMHAGGGGGGGNGVGVSPMNGGGGGAPNAGAAPAVGAGAGGLNPLHRGASFMMMHNQNSFGGPAPGMRNDGSMHGGGYMTGGPHFGSFSAAANPYQTNGSFSSSAGAGSLHRMNSGMNFDYYNHSQMNLGAGAPLSRNNSAFGSMRRGSFMGSTNGSAAGGPPGQQLSRQDSGMGGSSYSYGSFRQPSFSHGAAHRGATGVGPNMSMNSIGSGVSQHEFAGAAAPGNNGGGGGDKTSGVSPSSLTRQDSAMALQRNYSIAGQFYDHGNNGMGPGGAAGAGGGMPGSGVGAMRRPSMPMGMMGAMGPMPGMALTIGGLDGRMNQRPIGQGAMSPQAQQMMMHQQMMMQRRLASGNGAEEDANAAPPKGTSENAVVEEGQSMALGRKNSVQNLTRKASEKRVGMYFKNKDVTEVADGSTYKKEGDTGTLGKNNARARDPSLTNTVKASIVLDTSGGTSKAIEVDGRTIRAEKPGAEEVQKYDMRDVIFANRATDGEILSDSLEEMRDNFVYGCNVGMVMADAGMSSARPTEWFTWLALKSVVKGTFGKLASTQFEFTMSVCLLQDDQVMDVLADEPQRFVTLTVAESPLFGNVANGMVYVCVDNAGEFNEVLESALYRAQQQCSTAAEEHGIVLCTCVLKQVKTSPSTGKQDVLVSSIFASGVGSGVIHYNRILDKNPAEPRALFYSVLHRSVHSTALFSCAAKDEEIFNYLATLQRFSKTETRRPKVGSTRAFVSYGTSTIPKIREDLEKAKDPRQRMMMQRQLEKLELMVADAEDILENPIDSVPKTYI